MASRPNRDRSGDTLLDLNQAGRRVGYTGDHLRRMSTDRVAVNPPPLFKLNNGRWRVWQSDLDAWIERQRALTGAA